MQFDIIASTGRTATTHIASLLDELPNLCVCHEGYIGGDKSTEPLLPLINLENAQAFTSDVSANKIVDRTRGADVLSKAMKKAKTTHLIDVAYYNPSLVQALLRAHSNLRVIGIIRDCSDFVRSATTLTGEDPLPVGWPDPEKPLTEREKFISLGRIRPLRGTPEKNNWPAWGAVRRNIWLWHVTNLRLTAAKEAYPERVRLLKFGWLKTDPKVFWDGITEHLGLAQKITPQDLRTAKAINKKPFAYQIGPPDTWSKEDRDALARARANINELANYD